MHGRYYTLHFLDGFSNATNLGTRALGPEGGTVWLTTTDSRADVPHEVRVFRLASPYTWLLMRIFVDGRDDIAAVHALQDAVRIRPIGPDVAAAASDEFAGSCRIPSVSTRRCTCRHSICACARTGTRRRRTRSCIDFAHWASVGHDRWTCMGGERTCDQRLRPATPTRWL